LDVEKLIQKGTYIFLHLPSILKALTTISLFVTTIFMCFGQSNLDFERWVVNYNGIDEAKHWINTSDASEFNAPVTLFRETDEPGSGQASVALTTAYWGEGAPYQLDTLVGALVQQVPYEGRPESFEFLYRAFPEYGDAVLIGVQLTMTVNDSTIVIGEGFYTNHEYQENWTKQVVEIDYYSAYPPDEINIIALSSANAALLDGSKGYAKIGSSLFLDNLRLNNGLETKPATAYYMHVFPNPAKSYLNVETNSPDNQQLEIYDLSGKLLVTTSFLNQSKIDISSLPSGTYIYKVFSQNSGEITATNKFNVIR
jgi:hypothetical protein